MDTPAGPAWSEATGEAAWIGERLPRSEPPTLTWVVPTGFESYARVLHPAEEPGRGGERLVRWAEAATWSGMPLRGDAQFHSLALPPTRPEGEAPWSSQRPHEGDLPDPSDTLMRVEAWVSDWVDQDVATLLSDGQAVISTSRGTVHATLTRPTRFRRGTLEIHTECDNRAAEAAGTTSATEVKQNCARRSPSLSVLPRRRTASARQD